MTKISTKEFVVLIILLFIISGAVYYFYYLQPKQEQISAINASIAANTAELEVLQSKQRQISDAKSEIELLAGSAEEITGIPTGIDEAELLILSSRAIGDLGENILYSFDPSIETLDFYQVNNATISFKTTYDGLVEILANFRDLKYRNNIINLSAGYNTNVLVQYGPEPVISDISAEDALAGGRGEIIAANQEVSNENTLQVTMRVDFFSYQGEIEAKSYDFLTNPIDNDEMFMTDADLDGD